MQKPVRSTQAPAKGQGSLPGAGPAVPESGAQSGGRAVGAGLVSDNGVSVRTGSHPGRGQGKELLKY